MTKAMSPIYKARVRSAMLAMRGGRNFSTYEDIDDAVEPLRKALAYDDVNLAMMLFGAAFHRFTDYKYAGSIVQMREAWFLWGRLSGESKEVAFPVRAAVSAWQKWEADNA
ncbi:MAG: hypothetical protein EBS70_01870 [Actinobacteria bacterium]|jgi:hypothetical protein|nr:hypothetical protein [Actinomycetota bacterium]